MYDCMYTFVLKLNHAVLYVRVRLVVWLISLCFTTMSWRIRHPAKLPLRKLGVTCLLYIKFGNNGSHILRLISQDIHGTAEQKIFKRACN